MLERPTLSVDDTSLDTQPSNDLIVSLEEAKDPLQENRELSPLVSWVQERYSRAKDKRRGDEDRWLEAYKNFRGLYDSSTAIPTEERSKVFIKVTKTKVLAAVAQMGDVLFAGNKFPIGIEPTPVPLSELPEMVHFDFKDQSDKKEGQGGGGLPTTITRPEILTSLKDYGLDRVPEGKLKEGPGRTPTSATYEPIALAAKKMEKKIHDQLEESDASKHLRYMAFEMALFGTGIIKGPFAVDKEYPNWSHDEEAGKALYQPVVKTIPKITAVSIWDFYPDADAKNMAECEGVVERHKMSASQLRELKKRPMFRKDSIDEALFRGFNYSPEHWESELQDYNETARQIERYEVLEYWGMISKEVAEDSGLDIPESMEDMDEFQINAWICHDQILRLVLNPYTPVHIPYYATPYEISPYSFFGVGVAENMSDTQMLMNGTMRMAVDNLSMSGNVIFEVNENNLVPGQDLKLYPGKVFRTTGAPGQAIFSTKPQNVTQEILALYDKARQVADEATSMPSYAHGGTGVTGVGRTASGMSMLMGAAAQNIKAIVRNIDDYFLAPLGRNLFAFNMQFDYDPTIKGDLAVVAKGTESLMRNEIRSQRLLQFLQTGSANPVTAPLVKADYILRELATALDLDEEKVVNDPREMAIQANLIKEMGLAMGTARQPPQGQQGAPNPNDPTGTGGGNIAPGSAPEPGANGFTGAGGGANGGNPPQQPGPQQGGQ